MININLVHNQIPNEIDIPKSKNSYKRLTLISIFSLLSLILLSYIFYSFTAHYLKYKTNSIKTMSDEKVSKTAKTASKTQIKPKTNIMKKKKMPAKTDKVKQPNISKTTNSKPIFSFNVSLNNMAEKPIKKEKQKNPALKSNKTNEQKGNSKIVDAQKKLYSITIITKCRTQTNRLKKLLNSKNIISKTTKKLYRSKILYDVYVGGLSSYDETMKFKKALIEKGYSVFSIKNINLFYYLNIAKNIDKSLKNKYAAIWNKTEFKIILSKHIKKFYHYETICRLNQDSINILKKRGYFIRMEKQSGV